MLLGAPQGITLRAQPRTWRQRYRASASGYFYTPFHRLRSENSPYQLKFVHSLNSITAMSSCQWDVESRGTRAVEVWVFHCDGGPVLMSYLLIFLLCRGCHCPGINREDDRNGSSETPFGEARAETPVLLEPGKAAPVLSGRPLGFWAFGVFF